MTEATDAHVKLTSDVALPHLITKTIETYAESFHSKHAHRFKYSALRIALSRVADKFRCETALLTEKGIYQANADDWDVRRAVNDTLDTIHIRILGDFGEPLFTSEVVQSETLAE